MNKLFEGKRFQAMKTACLLVTEWDVKLRGRFPKCWRVAKDSNTAIPYLCLVYDPTSPLRDDNYTSQSRKEAALAIVETKRKEVEERFATLGSDDIVDALQEILKFIDDYTWRSIVQSEHIYDNNEKQILALINADKDTDRIKASMDAGKLAANNKLLAGEIKALWNEYTGGDELAKSLIRQRRPLTPEEVSAWELPDTRKKWMEELGEEDVLPEKQT